MSKYAVFNGRNNIIPSAIFKIDYSGLDQAGLNSEFSMAVIGDYEGVIEPKKPYAVANSAQAYQVVDRNSDLALGAKLGFDPAKSVSGANKIYLCGVNPATQSSIVLGDALALSEDSMTVKTALYGQKANFVTLKTEAGSTSGYKLTVGLNDFVEVLDNVGKSLFTIQYTGDASTATMNIGNAGDLTQLVLQSTLAGDQTDGSVNLNINLADFDNMKDLANFINNQTGYSTTIISTSASVDKPIEIDAILPATDIKTSSITITADTQAVLDSFNDLSSLVIAEPVANQIHLKPEYIAQTYLSGAVHGVASNVDWENVFTELEQINVQYIVVLTSDASIHQILDAHCKRMAKLGLARRGYVGSDLQSWTTPATRTTSISNLKTIAMNLNSDKITHPGLGVRILDVNGDEKLVPSYFTACMFAGIRAGNSPVHPITQDLLNVTGLEAELYFEEAEELVANGLAVPMKDAINGRGYVVSRQVTTWLVDDNLARIEDSINNGADAIATNIVKRHSVKVGGEGIIKNVRFLIADTNAVLRIAKEQGWIVDFDPLATVANVVNDVVCIEYDAIITPPINFIFSTFHLKPLKITLTATLPTNI